MARRNSTKARGIWNQVVTTNSDLIPRSLRPGGGLQRIAAGGAGGVSQGDLLLQRRRIDPGTDARGRRGRSFSPAPETSNRSAAPVDSSRNATSTRSGPPVSTTIASAWRRREARATPKYRNQPKPSDPACDRQLRPRRRRQPEQDAGFRAAWREFGQGKRRSHWRIVIWVVTVADDRSRHRQDHRQQPQQRRQECERAATSAPARPPASGAASVARANTTGSANRPPIAPPRKPGRRAGGEPPRDIAVRCAKLIDDQDRLPPCRQSRASRHRDHRRRYQRDDQQHKSGA